MSELKKQYWSTWEALWGKRFSPSHTPSPDEFKIGLQIKTKTIEIIDLLTKLGEE